LWTRPKIAKMLEAIDRSGHIFTHRWGDAPIHTLLVQAYVPKRKVFHFTNFAYQHANYKWPIGK